MKKIYFHKILCIMVVVMCLSLLMSCSAEIGEMTETETELETVFTDGMGLFAVISTGSAQFSAENDVEVDGVMYHKVTDTRFPSYQVMRKALLKYFTEECTDKIMEQSLYRDIEGKLMVEGEGKGDNRVWSKAKLVEYDKGKNTAWFEVTTPNSTERYNAEFAVTEERYYIKAVTDTKNQSALYN
ncbi:MAG: DL-endopeptidase inhibitor IseA family protein [Oscillospiraceae bacterium]|nr:DL-endopeptidase inhibitor IseA family protein [Oscillospiraceae bacterium]MDD4414415.1 DL-endopeptidase inhibitor IseA family protein [Oscillospiraceae bacterium]